MMLDERWGEIEQAVADGLRTMLAKECDSRTVRDAETAGDGRDIRLETKLAEFGLWQLPPIPGVLAAASWELGRVLAPVGFPEVAAVSAVVGRQLAWAEHGWAPVTDAGEAVASDPEGSLVLGVTGAPRRTTAGDVLVPVTPTAEVLGDAAAGSRVRRLYRLLAAARAVGAAEGVVGLGVDYAGRRRQFGRAIGSFQAVAHRLSDAATLADGAALAIRKAAWVADPQQGGDGAPPTSFATMARAAAEEAASVAASTVHQVMGGYGFAMEEDCQLFSRRIRSWPLRLPPIASELQALGRDMIDPAQRDQIPWLWHHRRGMPLPRWAVESDGAGQAGADAR